MTILIVIARFRFGGVSRQAFNLASYLKENGYAPVILAREMEDLRYGELLSAHGIAHDIIDLKKGQSKLFKETRFFISLIRQLRQYKPFAIFPFNKDLGYSINLIWRLTGAKKSFHMERNNGEDIETTWVGKILRRISMWNATALLYNSNAGAETSPLPRKSFVIKNVFLKSMEKIQEPESDFIPDDGWGVPTLIHVANISAQKNYKLLLDCWSRLRELYPSIQFIILGSLSTNENPAIVEQLKQPGILFLSSRSNVEYFVQRSDVCILSSFKEGCPNVVLEYIHCRKIVVASNIPSIQEVLADSNHFLLFDNNSETDFVNKVSMALQLDASEKNRIVNENFEKLNREYSKDNFKQYLELISYNVND